MPAKINLIGQRFGKLLVQEETPNRRLGSVVWKCLCDCGKEVEYSTHQLRSEGLISCPSCGHTRNPKTNNRENIIGKKFNHLTVIDTSNRRSSGKILYKCECDCLNHTIIYVSSTDLKNGHTKSCGCVARKYQSGDIINNRLILNNSYNDNNHNHYYKCKCLLCGREYNALTQTIDNTISCGCQRSIGEFNIIQLLQKNNIIYKKEFCFPKSLLRYDFALLDNKYNVIRLIEFDGEQHYLNKIRNSGWNTLDKFLYTEQKDIEKNQLAQKYNIPLVRIPYWERNNLTLDMLLTDKFLVK